MPRPIRLRKPPSAPNATATTTTTTTAATKKAAPTAKSRTTRSGTKDIPNNSSPEQLPTPSSEDVPAKPNPAKKAAATKRSTRSKASPPPRATTPLKQPTRTRRKAVKETEKAPTKEPTPAPAAAPSPPPPSTPELQPLASSDAENHTPHFTSSPPIPRPKRRVVLDFDSDGGYSPPPKPTSAERPRLRELQPISLEPLDAATAVDDEETDTTDPRASPTPKRGRKTGFLPPAEDDLPTPRGFFIDGDEDEFLIYSDKHSPPPPPPMTAVDEALMRPPMSSSPEPTPKQRKRRSSGAVVDSEEDTPSHNPEDDRTTKKRRGKQPAKERVSVMLTSALMDLLPRRRKHTRSAQVGVFEILSTSSDQNEQDEVEVDSDADELSKPAGRTTRSRGKKVMGLAEKVNSKTKAKGKGRAAVGKTYSRRSIGSEKENGKTREEESEEGNSSDTVVTTEALGKKERKSLKKVKEKFEEVDKWQMEYEDLSPGSLEAGSSGGR